MDLNWFQIGPIPNNEMTGTYNYGLVTLSYVIAVLASYVALDLAGRLRAEANPRIQIYWLLGGAFAMGAGIWSMHFIGMLSFVMPMPMGYEFSWTIASLFIAILASALALFMLKNKDRPIFYMIIGGIFIGLGIAAMHYMGMQAMTSYVTIHYLPGIFFLSILIAISASEAALWLVLQSSRGSFARQFFLKIISALIMGVAICGMHYTGMFAAIFTPLPYTTTIHAEIINPYLLAFLIAAITAVIIVLALTVSIYYQLMETAIQKEKQFLNTMLNNLVDGILACDTAGIITVCNNALGKYCQIGKNHSYMDLDKHFQFKIPNAESFVSPKENPLYRTLKGENIRGQEYLMCFPNQNDREVIIDGQPILDAEGKKLGAVIVIHDVTYLKQAEHVKQEFISVVSHELRTPLTSIRGSLSLVLSGVMGDLSDKASNLLKIASNNCERLIDLINDILDVDKLESGKIEMELKPISISKIVKEAIIANQMYADLFSVSVELANDLPAATVNANYARLMQVLNNLLSNAIKFSPPHQSVSIEITHNDNMIRVVVSDKGKGISEEFRERIFLKFSQSDTSSTRKVSGTGLGLNIAKGIITAMHGKLDFYNNTNQGATFYFELPISSEACLYETEKANHAQILICEEDVKQAEDLKKIMTQSGYQCDIAKNAIEAKAMLKENIYQVLLVDLQLSDQKGVSLIQDIQKVSKLPIVVISEPENVIEREMLNVDAFTIIDWLEKPLDYHRLLLVLDFIKKDS